MSILQTQKTHLSITLCHQWTMIGSIRSIVLLLRRFHAIQVRSSSYLATLESMSLLLYVMGRHGRSSRPRSHHRSARGRYRCQNQLVFMKLLQRRPTGCCVSLGLTQCSNGKAPRFPDIVQGRFSSMLSSSATSRGILTQTPKLIVSIANLTYGRSW